MTATYDLNTVASIATWCSIDLSAYDDMGWNDKALVPTRCFRKSAGHGGFIFLHIGYDPADVHRDFVVKIFWGPAS